MRNFIDRHDRKITAAAMVVMGLVAVMELAFVFAAISQARPYSDDLLDFVICLALIFSLLLTRQGRDGS